MEMVSNISQQKRAGSRRKVSHDVWTKEKLLKHIGGYVWLFIARSLLGA